MSLYCNTYTYSIFFFVLIYTVYKHKDHDPRGESAASASAAAAKESDKKAPTEPAFIPVVGENEPELKPAGPTKGARKRLDPGQLATDDFHYDKYKKRSRRY
jgi:hypothetical protein